VGETTLGANNGKKTRKEDRGKGRESTSTTSVVTVVPSNFSAMVAPMVGDLA